jgi:Thiol:disulfide interchange protein DsbD, N-terminal
MKTLICFFLFMAAPDPVSWQAREGPAKPVKAGAPFTVKLAARIQNGWHLYSMKPLEEGPIPTRIWLAEGQPFRLNGRVQAAEPEKVQDPSFNMEVEIYEGDAEFTLPLRVAPGATPGAGKVIVNTSYQTCDNRVCLPPKTVKVEVPVTIAPQTASK